VQSITPSLVLPSLCAQTVATSSSEEANDSTSISQSRAQAKNQNSDSLVACLGRCIATTIRGNRCTRYRLRGSQYCRVHDPTKPRKHRGILKSRISTKEDIERLIAETIRKIELGKLEPRQATAIIYAANAAMRLLGIGQKLKLEQQDELEFEIAYGDSS
jgi:hypothetical protein